MLDIDECAAQTAQCDVDHATCENLPGTFTCTCDVGYTGDGFTCTGKILFHLPLLFLSIGPFVWFILCVGGRGGKGTEIVLFCYRIFQLMYN